MRKDGSGQNKIVKMVETRWVVFEATSKAMQQNTLINNANQ